MSSDGAHLEADSAVFSPLERSTDAAASRQIVSHLEAFAVGLSRLEAEKVLRFPDRSIRGLIADLFQRLGRVTTAAEALAIADESGAQGAALIELEILARRRAHALSHADAFGDRT